MPRVPVESIHPDPDNHPPQDDALIALLMDLANGRTKMFWAAIPLRYVRPFSPTYKPMSWAPWEQLFNEYVERIKNNKFPPLLTYQVGDFYVLSDDYAQYYAYLECDSEYAHCYVIGAPRGDHAAKVRPATEAETKRQLGLD